LSKNPDPLAGKTPDELKALREHARRRKEQRIEAKIAAGEAVRAPLDVVVQPGQDIEAAIESEKARILAELRKAGEVREIYFDEPVAITTGVLRSADFGRDWAPLPPTEWYPKRYAAQDKHRKPAITRPSESPAEPEWRPIRTSIAPRSDDDPGAVLTGTYAIDQYNRLCVRDADDRDLGSEMLSEADDVEVAARRILRTAKRNDFYAPIEYPRTYH
jgi:hypothetical protein